MLQTKNRMPGQPLSANDIEAMLKDPQSLFFKEYNAALMLYADLQRLENAETIIQQITTLKEDVLKRKAHKEEKIEDEEIAQAQAQIDTIHRKRLQEINRQFETKYPELVPQLAQLAFYLDEWRAADTALTNVQAQQQTAMHDWKKTQTKFAENAMAIITNEALMFDDGSHVPPILTEHDKREIRTAFNSSIIPLKALEKNPYKLDQLKQETKKIIQSLGKDEAAMDLSDMASVRQEAVEKANINNQAVLNMMIKVIVPLAGSMKKNLTEEEYNRIQWPHPKQTVHRNLEALLLKHISIRDLKAKIRDLNNSYIENNLQMDQLSQQREENIIHVKDALEGIYTTLCRDPEMRDALSTMMGDLPLNASDKHIATPPF